MALKEEKLILKGKRDFDEGEEHLGVRGNGFSGGGGRVDMRKRMGL